MTRVVAAAQACDDAALAALASKGLLRRAHKDVEQSPPRILGADGDAVRVAVEDVEVRVPVVLARATCSCASLTVCRHVLAAVLALRATAAAPDAQGASGEEELLGLADDALAAWAGAARWRRALAVVARGVDVYCEAGTSFVLRLPAQHVTCHWLPGAGTAGMLCSCHAAGVCDHRVIAVLAAQVRAGRRTVAAELGVLPEPRGAPRPRAAVLATVGNLLAELVGVGVSRLTHAAEQRLRTLALSAHGVDLPRLERALRVLGEATRGLLGRETHATLGAWMEAAARVEALRAGLAAGRATLVGEHRTRYEDVGTLELAGVGAHRWRNAAGRIGLTVVFRDLAAPRWVTWTDARAETVAGFDPGRRYAEAGPWRGCASPQSLIGRRVRLSGAWCNRQGRISGRPHTRALPGAPVDLATLVPPVSRWRELASQAFRWFAGGLGEREAQDEWVWLAVRHAGPAAFDALRQELTVPILDEAGHRLMLVLPHTRDTADALGRLERTDFVQVRQVLGRLRLRDGHLAVEPIALHGPHGIVSLTLAGAAVPTAAPAAPDVENREEDEADVLDAPEGESAVMSSGTSRVQRELTALTSLLDARAEAGLFMKWDDAPLGACAHRLRALGLEACAGVIRRLLSPPAQDAEPLARRLLYARYVAGLALDLAIVQQAVEEAD